MILFTYILKWALCLAVLYIPFALLLRRETFATFNRILLIGIIAVSCILPAITVTIPVEVGISEAIESFGNGALAVTGRAIGSASDTGKAWNALFSMDTLLALYIAGAAAALLQKAIGAVKVGRAIERGVVWTDREKNMTIHCRADECAPFSWFGHIVISQKDYDECGREILLHEEGHILHRHSWDMVLMSIVKSLQWFNPFVYLLENDLKEIHEFEADRHVMLHQADTRAYQMLLLRKAAGEKALNLTNNFNQSSVRRRITMMARRRSPNWKKVKALFALPLCALLLLLFAKPVYVYSSKAQAETASNRANAAKLATAVETSAANEKETAAVEPAVKRPAPKKKSTATAGNSTNTAQAMQPTGTTTATEHTAAEPASRSNEEENRTTLLIEPYYEYINIDKSPLCSELDGSGINRCSIRLRFTAGKDGTANEISAGGCNISMKPGENAACIEDMNRLAREAAASHIAQKRWYPSTGEENCRTIFEAHIIFHHGEESVMAANGTTRPLVVGLTPIK